MQNNKSNVLDRHNKAGIIVVKKFLAVAVITASIVPAAHAKQPFYLFGEGGIALQEFNKVDGFDIEDADIAYTIGAGIPLNKNFSAEIGYSRGGSFEVTHIGSGESFSLKVDSISLGLRGTYAFNRNLHAYGRIGLHRWEVEGSYAGYDWEVLDGTEMYYGVGVGYKITKHIALTTGFTRVDVENVHINTFTVGIVAGF